MDLIASPFFVNAHLNNVLPTRRNFTEAEIAYCLAQPDPRASFTGRWCAKEATIKALSSRHPEHAKVWDGAGAPLKYVLLHKRLRKITLN